MSVTEKIEEKLGLKIEDLNEIEKETYLQMLKQVEKSQLTLDKLLKHIISLRESVTKELIKEPEFNYIFIFKIPNRNQILLKARLQNYVLLEQILTAPQKAQEMLEDMIGSIGGGVK